MIATDQFSRLQQILDLAWEILFESIVTICRDPNDNFLLALAKDGNADYLLTGDKDLLELKKSGKTKIKTITSFIDEAKNTANKSILQVGHLNISYAYPSFVSGLTEFYLAFSCQLQLQYINHPQ